MKKLLLTIVAVFLMSGIASAATQMDIKGQIRVYPEMNNFGRSSGLLPDYLLTSRTSKNNLFTDQRTRLYFNAKSNENVGANIALEIDSFWGQEAFGVNRGGTGAGQGTDSVNIEVKYANFWFKPTNAMKVTAGTQTFVDDMAGVFIGGGDMAGFRADFAMGGAASLATGIYTWWQTQYASTSAWKDSVYFIPITVKLQLGPGALSLFTYTIQDGTKATTAGGFASPVNGYRPTALAYDSAQIYYSGVNYGGKAGNVSYFLMGVYNSGKIKNVATSTTTTEDQKISAFALSGKVDVKLGAGKLRLNSLYISGTDVKTDTSKYAGFVTGDQYAGHMTMPMLQDDLIILINNTDVTSNATFLLTTPNNNGDGVRVAYAAYDHDLTARLNAKAVFGYAAANEQNVAARSGKNMGTEFDAHLKFKFDENLTIGAVGSYAWLGDYYKTSSYSPDNAYRLWLKFIYTF